MIKRLLGLWKRQTFAKQISMTFICIFLLQLLLVLGIAGGYLSRVVEEKIMDFSKLTLHQASLNISTTIKGYIKAVNQMTIDENFIEYVNQLKSDTPKINITGKQNLRNEMRTFLSYRQPVRTMAVITDNNKVFSYDRLEIDSIYQEAPKLYDEYFKQINWDDELWKSEKWIGAEFFDRQGTSNYYLITYNKQLYDWYSKKVIGSFFMSIDESILADICLEAQISRNEEDNFLFIIDEDNKIVSHFNKDYLGKEISNIYNWDHELVYDNTMKNINIIEVENHGRSAFVSVEHIPDSNWRIVSVLDKNYILGETQNFQRMITIVSLILGLFVILLVTYVSKKMSKSIGEIVSTMTNIEEGELSAKIKVSKEEKNEVAIIANQFNKMMKAINDEMELVKISGQKEKEAEIRALEAQINPHFIYNTLDSINWLAIENNQNEISKMLSQFAMILRYQINKSNTLVTIGEEISYLEKYLYLQKVRFNDSFEYMINCEEEVRECKLYKMIFQPFIENAIIHGYENIDYCGLLTVDIKRYDKDYLKFTISDNGKGMSNEMIKAIFVDRENPGNSIGILNVLLRLDMYYGNDYRLEVSNKESGGIIIGIIIPMRY